MMNPTKLILITAVLLMFVFWVDMVHAEEAPKRPQLIVTQERADKTYNVGDKVIFTIKVAHENGDALQGIMKVQINLTQDGGDSLPGEFVHDNQPISPNQMIEISDTPLQVQYTLTGPGFVRMTAIGRFWQGKGMYLAASTSAGCEPLKIQPMATMPEDFEKFWKQGQSQLAKLPLDFQKQKVDTLSNDERDVYQISFANINDTRIHGYLAVPKTGKATYPVLISVAPAGVGKPRERDILGQITRTDNQAICLYMGVYDHELGQPPAFYKTFKSKDSTGNAFCPPEQYFFYRVALGIDRAINWLVSREDVDTRHVVYYGSSQGGGMGLILTGLNKNITASGISDPALCDHLGYLAGRAPGWPHILSHYRRRGLSEDQIKLAATCLPYFDAANFARLIKVPVLFSMGYNDITCSPSSVYSAYNVIQSPKSIIVEPDAGHGLTGSEARAKITEWLMQHMGIEAVAK